MSSDVILCPHCGRQVEISQAVAAGMRKQIESETRIAHQAKERALAEREAEAAQREARLAAQAKEAEQRIQAEVAKQARLAQEQAKAEAQRAAAGELGLLKEQVEAARKERDAAQAKELELRARQEALAEKEKALDLTLARRLDEERGRLAEAAQRNAAEAYELKLKDRDEQAAVLKRTIDELKRRSEQGSMQTQGEALETSLEDLLRREFPGDLVEPVPKGKRGADLVQRVRGPGGLEAGTIVWESKRTKAWGGDWTVKLKDDQREMRGHVAALVSQTLPAGAPAISCIDGVWVCSFAAVAGMAALLRKALIDLASERRSQENRSDKEALLYAYLTGGGFKGRLQGMLEPFYAMEKDLQKEKAAFQRVWAAREQQIEKVKKSILGMHGDVDGIAGNVLPEIDLLGLPEPSQEGPPPERDPA